MIKDINEFIEKAESLKYTFAKTYAKTNPHEYCFVGNNPKLLPLVQDLNRFIQEHGEKEMFYQTEFDVLFAGDYKYWSMDYWTNTQILNRNWDFKNPDGTINKSKTEDRKKH